MVSAMTAMITIMAGERRFQSAQTLAYRDIFWLFLIMSDVLILSWKCCISAYEDHRLCCA